MNFLKGIDWHKIIYELIMHCLPDALLYALRCPLHARAVYPWKGAICGKKASLILQPPRRVRLDNCLGHKFSFPIHKDLESSTWMQLFCTMLFWKAIITFCAVKLIPHPQTPLLRNLVCIFDTTTHFRNKHNVFKISVLHFESVEF